MHMYIYLRINIKKLKTKCSLVPILGNSNGVFQS